MLHETDTASDGLARRDLLSAAAVAGTVAVASTPATAQPAANPRAQSLEAAFRALFDHPADARKAAGDARLAFLAPGAWVIDHDVPFVLDAAGYADHMAFHADSWERYEFRLHHVETRVHGATGVVSAYAFERGKPKTAGFRLRTCFVTAVCAWSGGGWQAVALHISPINAQIIDASPA